MTGRRARLMRWIRLGTEYLFASGLGQILGMVAGLIYVRVLSVEQYALYGLALTTITFVALTSDIGVSGSITYFWRHCREKSLAFAPCLSAIRRFRWALFVPAAIVSGTILYFTTEHYANPTAAVIVIGIVILTSLVALEYSIWQGILRIAGRYRASYLADLTGQICRLAVAAGIWLGAPATAIVALLGTLLGGVVSLCVNRVVRNTAVAVFPVGQDAEDWNRKLRRYIIPVAPSVLLFAFQDSAVYWTASQSGGPTIVAETFALGRIAVIFTLVSNFIVQIVTPRLAGIADSRNYNRAAWAMRGLLFVGGTFAVLFVWLFPAPFLLLIGPKYSHLSIELVVITAGAAVNLVSSASVLANRAQGWVRRDVAFVIVQGAIMLMLLLFWPMTSTLNVCLLLLTGGVIGLLVNHIIALIGHFRSDLVELSHGTDKR